MAPDSPIVKSNMLKEQTPYHPQLFQQRNWLRPFSTLLPVFGAVLYSMLVPSAAHALTNGVTITSITPFAALDSNNSCGAGPRAMYLQVDVQNTTGIPLTDLSANINSFSNSAFTLDAGESATRYIGNLGAGKTTSLYWYVNYPCQSGRIFPNTNYTVTLSDSNPGTVTSSSFTLTTRSEISASAGGDIATALIGAGAVPGQIIPYTVNYDFGNPAAGAEVMIQPAGNVSFDSSCFRLIGTDITSSTFTAGPLTTNDNRLFFTGVKGGSSNTLTVAYFFMSLCNSAGTIAKPFASQTSGGPQKYTGNYETYISAGFPPSTNPFVITKSASSATLPTGGIVTYTVTVSNPSSYNAIIDRITDILPPNVTYGSLVTGTSTTIISGSTSQPIAGATGTINWVGNPNTSYSLPAGGSLTLKYTANVPNVVGSYTNSATTTAGSSTTAPVTATVSVGISDLTLTKTHTGNFTLGTPGSYALSVKNIGTAPTTSTITVTDTLPGGLTIPNGAVTLTGTNAANWSCSAVSNVITCSSTTAIATNGNSTFNLTGIQVGAAAIPSITNNAVVAGGNEVNVSNNTATDLTNVKVSPTIDLDGNDSSGATGNDFKTSFTLAGSAIGVVDTNTSSTETLDTVITDSDSTQLSKAVINLTNAQPGDSLTVSGTLPTGISLDPSSTATRIVLTGNATLASYETALEQIRFSTTSSSLNDRTITVQVTDDTSLASNIATITIGIVSVDYGDAPDTYGTNSTNNNGEGVGANHVIVNTLKLGTNAPDSETDAQTPLDGTGDGTDEDGITTFPSLNITTSTYSLTTTVNNTTGSAANVYGWIDFERDGKFDGDERATVSNGSITLSGGKVPTGSNGTVTLTWNNIGGTGANIIDGNSYARIRLTTDNLSAATATTTRDTASVDNATNGEVEDYAIAIASDGNRPLGSPFTCNSTFYITTGSGGINPQSLYDVNRSGSTYVFIPRGPSTSNTNGYPNTFSYSALAYNPVDNYLYGFITNSSAATGVYATGNVVKIGNDGILRSLGKPTDGSGGTLPITNYYAATMLADGTYVIGQAGNFAKLNVTTSPPTILSTGSLSGVNFTDFAVDPTDPTSLSGGKIYGINEGDGENHLVIINVAGNNPTIVSQATNSTGFSDNAGSQFVDSFGTLYYRSSTNNSLYRVDNDPNSPNYGQATLITTTPSGGNSDGASCLFASAMQKEVQNTAGNTITTSPAGKVVKYVYSIASGNVQNLAGVTFQDDLRAVSNGNPINGTFTGTYTVSNGSGTVSFSNNNQTIQISNLVIPAQTQATPGADKLTITAEVKVSKTLTPGTYFNQSSITNLPSTYPSSIPSDYPLSPAYQDPTPLQITAPIASDPKLLLVKRITAINPGQPDAIQFNNFVNDGPPTDDEASNWPDSDSNPSINTYLRGAINVPGVKPGDEVEYTIYFLSNGDADAKNIQICDAVPDNMTFVNHSYSTNFGMALLNGTTLLNTSNKNLSNAIGDDEGDFYPPGTNPLINLCKKHDPNDTDNLIPHNLIPVDSSNNLSGAVLIKLNTPLPPATAPGTPANSYGFVRFRAKVK
jgi:uncharacterized repeat protein (TIGR01451 family)